jgi:hypothetical protein
MKVPTNLVEPRGDTIITGGEGPAINQKKCSPCGSTKFFAIFAMTMSPENAPLHSGANCSKHEETRRRRAHGGGAEVGKYRRHTYCAGRQRRRQRLLCNAVTGHPHCLLPQGGHPQQRLEQHDGVSPRRGRGTQRRRPREGSAAARNQTPARGWNHRVVGGAL